MTKCLNNVKVLRNRRRVPSAEFLLGQVSFGVFWRDKGEVAIMPQSGAEEQRPEVHRTTDCLRLAGASGIPLVTYPGPRPEGF